MVKRRFFAGFVVVLAFWLPAGRCTADERSMLERADGYREKSEYLKAQEIYKQIISESNDIGQVLAAQQRLTISYIESSDELRAKAALQELVTRFAGHQAIAETVFHVADEYVDAKKEDRAREVYQYVVDHWPQAEYAIRAQVMITQLSIRSKDEAAAQRGYDDLISKFAGNEQLAKAVDHVADAYRKGDNYKKARAIYQYIVETWPQAEHAMESQRGVVLSSIRLGDDANAATDLEKLIGDFGQNEGIAKAVRQVGDEYCDANTYDRALGIYEYAIGEWPEAEDAVESQKGIVLANTLLGEETAAQQAFEDFVEKFRTKEDSEEVAFDLANDCRDLKKNKVALAVYERVAENWPGTDEAIDSQTNTAKLYISLGDDPNAEAAIGELLKDFDEHNLIIRSIQDVAKSWAEARRYEKAAELYRYIVKHWAGSKWALEAQKRLARMYIQIGDYEKADAAAAKLIESFSNAEGIAAAIEDVADMYQMVGSQAKSYPLHRYVLEHWPEHERAIWCQMKAIMSQLRLSDLAKAEEELGNLLTDFAGHKELGPAVHEVVEEYRDTGAHEEGRELFAYLLENWDETPDTMLELQVGIALQSIKLREPNKADAAVQRLIADYNDHPKIGKGLFQIAEETYYAGNYRKAMDLWKLVRRRYSDRQLVIKEELPFMIGNCHQLLDEHDNAIEYYEETVDEHPGTGRAAEACYEIGMTYFLQKKDYDQAVEWLERFLEVRPDKRRYGERGLFHLIVIYTQKTKDYQKGVAAAQQYAQEYPRGQGLWGVLVNMARCYENMGNVEEAIAVLREAYEVRTEEGLRSHITDTIARLEKGGA
ncbi:MAG: tetratricopeptide repeat protein [Planctomycetota bacterium]|jgi:tetratricopeptide (TPR) repeat protein